MHTDLMYMKYYMKSYHVFQYVAQIVGSFFAALIFHISTPKLPEKNALSVWERAQDQAFFKEDKPEVVKSFKKLIEEGVYSTDLYSDL